MLLLCTFALCGMMTGIIWFVQINHYPLMLKVGAAEFAEYERMHTKLAGQLIAPIMLAEAALSLALAVCEGSNIQFSIFTLVLLLLIWISTFTVQVPLHNQLRNGYDAALIKRLVRTNWLRTLLWTVRLVVLGWLLLAKVETHRLYRAQDFFIVRKNSIVSSTLFSSFIFEGSF